MSFYTNIKGLPEGKTYFTMYAYSDAYAYVVIHETEKTRVLAMVKTKEDPEYKPNFDVGGFCAHCSNNSEQTYIYDGIEDNKDLQVTIRLNKKGEWRKQGTLFKKDKAIRFYDFNF